MSKSLKSLLVLAFLVVVFAGYYYKNSSSKNSIVSDTKNPETINYPGNESQTENIKNWEDFSDPSGIFSFKFPGSASVNSSGSDTKISTKIETIADLVKNGFAAENEKEALASEKIGEVVAGSFADSNKILMLDSGKATGKGYVVFGDKSKCEVDMNLNLIFYYGDKRIKISYSISNFELRVSDEYLVASDKCENKILNESKFYSDLSTGKVSGEIQTFYNDFSQIEKSVKIY